MLFHSHKIVAITLPNKPNPKLNNPLKQLKWGSFENEANDEATIYMTIAVVHVNDGSPREQRLQEWRRLPWYHTKVTIIHLTVADVDNAIPSTSFWSRHCCAI